MNRILAHAVLFAFAVVGVTSAANGQGSEFNDCTRAAQASQPFYNTFGSCDVTRPQTGYAYGNYNIQKGWFFWCTKYPSGQQQGPSDLHYATAYGQCRLWSGGSSGDSSCTGYLADPQVTSYNQSTWYARNGYMDLNTGECFRTDLEQVYDNTCGFTYCDGCAMDDDCWDGDAHGIPADDCYYADGCPGDTGYYRIDNCCYFNGMSPILLDLTGNGFDLTDVAHGVQFDLGATGKPLHTAWTSAVARNAWLVLDRNSNGNIDSGAELFGNHTAQPTSTAPNGFLALAVFDLAANGGNADGVIDAHDAVFVRLRLWIDENHNGISEVSELHALPELGVRAIHLKYQQHKFKDLYGNEFRYRAKVEFEKQQGDKWAYDVFLKVKP